MSPTKCHREEKKLSTKGRVLETMLDLALDILKAHEETVPESSSRPPGSLCGGLVEPRTVNVAGH